ncbi:HAD-IA family hydrolase [Actibacterium sp. 188UL27-1]|uniref:HAD-IA family hydrolase n=1 Tax=Actibacterium sp. 188UL27-1 TaxID=2786961 RepID=UPI0019577546|nr:HAD-IA family hydrolase [Actibacterium sp. 188UL27-1]MBM7069970.1 HAD-IA family hydrolase [Actibacterium sp. 188UL27-1]
MTAPLHLVIFDVDGTLIDSQGQIISSMEAAFEAVHLPVPSPDQVREIIGLSLSVAMQRLAPGRPAQIHADLVESYKASFTQLLQQPDAGDHVRLFPGARDQVTALSMQDDMLLGIATGKSRRGLDRVLRVHGWERLFVTQQVADHHPSKPHPSMVETALNETGVAINCAVMIGDTTFDIQMGRAAGVATIGVAWGYHDVAALHDAGADMVIDSFDALPDALGGVWDRLDE